MDTAAPAVPETPLSPGDETAAAPAAAIGVEQELLVEDVSIDGMCGVY